MKNIFLAIFFQKFSFIKIKIIVIISKSQTKRKVSIQVDAAIAQKLYVFSN